MKTQMHSVHFNFGSLLLAMALCAVFGCNSAVEAPPKPATGTVSLVVDFQQESQADLDLKVGCAADSTVFDVLQRAEKAGDLKFEHSDNLTQESSSIFVKEINGVGQADGKSWTYYVNDELAKESCGTCAIKPDDS